MPMGRAVFSVFSLFLGGGRGGGDLLLGRIECILMG